MLSSGAQIVRDSVSFIVERASQKASEPYVRVCASSKRGVRLPDFMSCTNDSTVQVCVKSKC